MTFTRTFPDGFILGTATASYQIEGAVAEDGRAPSIWDTFSHTPGNTKGGHTGDVACDHYHRVAEDVALMRDLGIDAYRFSIAWPRILPGGTGAVNQPGIDFYSRLVDTLLESGIQPFATLYHWDLPQALDDRGGWLSRDSADWFAEYAGVIVGALGDRVSNWTTLNEPWCSSYLSYTLGAHAPGHTDPVEGMVAAHHLLLAHGRAVPVIRENCPRAEVSITLNPTQVYGPDDGGDDADADAVRRADNVYNGVFFSPVCTARYPDGFLEDTAALTDHAYIHDGDLTEIAAPLDNLGINNYYPTRVRAARDGESGSPLAGMERVVVEPPRPPHTAMGWEILPRGLYDILMRSAKEGGIPIYITENGSAWPDTVSADGQVHDPDRIGYLHGHLGAVADAIEDGADIRGYLAWSLLDNFEWAHGYGKRFGLIYVDYDTQERIIKDSGREYARIIRASHGT